MSSSVEDWLRSLGFINYTQDFLDNGYDELEICKEIGKEDLDAIGVRNFKDRTDILNAVSRLKQDGTAVYFELERNNETENIQAQPERERYPSIQLKMMLRDKLEEDKIDLTSSPYSRPDGTEGTLGTLVTLYADKFYTYEEEVLTALRSLRERQAVKQLPVNEIPSQPVQPPNSRKKSSRHSSKYKSGSSQERENESEQGYISDDDKPSRPVFTEDTESPTGMIPADYLGVDSPAHQEKKSREKKRRKVERNTNLSRSLDSLKELHVNMEPNPRQREASSFKSKSFRFKLFQGTKKKHHSVGESKKRSLEKQPINATTAKDYDLLASAIKMGEEDRKALMIMVKQGELSVEEAIDQLKQYEEDCRKEDYVKSAKDDPKNEEERPDSKSKVKRGLFGRSTKRKSGSRPSSGVIACEMIMSEEDRINLLKSVKNQELTVDQALKRFLSYEEKHKRSDSDDSNIPVKQSPRLPKSVTGFSRISIKRLSGVISSSFLPGTVPGENNSVFYTATDDHANADVGSAESSVSSGDEESTADSSPVASPKTLLANVQGLNKSQQSSSSSLDSVDKTEDKLTVNNVPNQPSNLMREMKEKLEKQMKPKDTREPEITEGNVGKPPPPSKRKSSSSSLEQQKVVPLPNSTSSVKTTPPEIPHRPSLPVAQPHRPPPPVPSRLPLQNSSKQGKENETNIAEPGTETVRSGIAVSIKTGVETQARRVPAKLDHNVEAKGVVLRRLGKPPPIPPRPVSPSFNEGQNGEKQVIAPAAKDKQCVKSPAFEVSGSKPSVADASGKPKPKAKPRPKPRPNIENLSDKEVRRPTPMKRSSLENILQACDDSDAYNEVPPPRSVKATQAEPVKDSQHNEPFKEVTPPRLVQVSQEDEETDSDDDKAYNEVPPPRPVEGSQKENTVDSDDDKAYNEVPPPRPAPVSQGKGAEDSDDGGGYTMVPPPRPVQRSVFPTSESPVARTDASNSSAVLRTEGASSGRNIDTRLERERSELQASEGTGGDQLPVPAPRIKRVSHSLSEMVERKLYLERIDLTQEPYSDRTGCWGVPMNLIDRYSEELHRSHAELAGIMDRIRVRKLKQAQRQAVPCNVSELDFRLDPVGNLNCLSDWLTSLGLPMYINSLAEVQCDDMASMPYLEERHFQFAGISDLRHMRRLLASVEQMPR
ncbi:serine/arginine repetitive matrix protein 1-like [Acropora muricata]|uniref:serine/arginine repetitive matrix protein 1-like n=1 Tax=Acropora muricata TaxID=159855 RepID=UPI0034E37C5C